MNIDVRRFVDINIKQHVETQMKGTRDVLVLYTHEGETETVSSEISSWSDANSKFPAGTFPDTNAYLEMYFKNNGAKAVVIEDMPYDALTKDIIKALPNEYILVGVCSAAGTVSQTYSKIKSLATELSNDNDVYGINEKILLGRTETISDTDEIANLAVKYSEILGAEMTIAAYLSRINVYGVNTVNDYMFTTEKIDEEFVSDTEYETIIANNMNINTYLAGNIRNLGGNLKDGADLVNSYVRIILHQSLTERLLKLLATKIKNIDGIGKIYAAMSKEMENYRACGYLSTDKIWTDESLIVEANKKSYTIIEKGTPLINGYHIQILPMSALTEQAKAERKTPPIYVIIADQYSIRSITINGEII